MDREKLAEELSRLENEVLEDDAEVFREVDEFYSDLKDYMKRILKHFESEFEETCEIPEVNVFAPIDSINGGSNSISEAEVLIGMSVYISRQRELREYIPEKHHPSIWKDFGGNFTPFRQVMPDEEIGDQEYNRIEELVRYLGQAELHASLGRYNPQRNCITMNTLVDFDIPEDKIPVILLPVYDYLSNRTSGESNVREAKITFVHEMTHAYIHQKSNYSEYTLEMKAVNEAATQTVNNLYRGSGHPPESYYRGEEAIDPELMQAAREAFFNSTAFMETEEAVSKIRLKAVEAINRIEDGKDPIKALRDEDDYRSKMVRIGAHTMKKTRDEVEDDLFSIGLENFVGGNYVPSSNLGPINRLKQDSNFGIVLFREEIKSELVEPTKKLISLAEKPREIVAESYWPDEWSDGRKKALEEIFGNPHWTDPGKLQGDEQLRKNLSFVLETYLEVIQTGFRRIRKLESVSREIQERSEKLIPKYENKDFREDMEKILKDSKNLEEELEEIKEDLENIEEMIEAAIKKIDRIADKNNQ